MVAIALLGYGKMGKMVEEVANTSGNHIVSLSEADVAIDFSHHSVVLDHIDQATTIGKPIVIGTTGWDDKLSLGQKIIEEKEGAALYSPNFSIGISLFLRIVKQAAALITPFVEYEMAGIEIHHSEKKDAPSGTAKKITEAIGGHLSFTSLRLGSVPGTHSVLFDSPVDTITLTHEARSREGFARGALLAAKWLIGKKGWYTFDEMVRALYCPHHSV